MAERHLSRVNALVLLSSLQTGGAERVTVSFMRRVAALGGHAAVCTVTDRHDDYLADELAQSGIVRHDLGARRLADPRALLNLVRLRRRERIGLIHAHGQDACVLAAAAKAMTRVPVILTRHVLDEPSTNWRQRLRARAALTAFSLADRAVAVSAAAASRLAQLAAISRDKLTVIRNGIDLSAFDRPELPQTASSLRRTLGIGESDFVVLLPAVLRAGKGHDVLLRALPLILARVPTLKLVFAGAGERESELRALAAPFGESVLFFGQRDDMPELLRASDLVVLPSEAEALPTVLIEASASARPVVATRVGGTPEVVEHGRTGLLVPTNDPRELAEAVLTLCFDADMRCAFGEEGRRLARLRFDLDRQVDQTLALWDRIASEASA